MSLDPTMTDPDAFLRWNSGHLLENRTRGAYAEWLVPRASASILASAVSSGPRWL
jgi:hypothetical protein